MALDTLHFGALILAAGYSLRMGQFKPRLPLGERSAIEYAISGFHTAGLREVIVVTGHRARELTNVLKGQVRCVFNPSYDSGMYSSSVSRLQWLPPRAHAFLVRPPDIPLVRATT